MARRATAIVLVLAVLASVRPARAESGSGDFGATPVGRGFVWAVGAIELLGAIAIALDVNVAAIHDNDAAEATVLVLPTLLGAGIGALAGWRGWPMAVPKAVHGALLTGFDLFLAGTLTHGAMEPKGEGIRVGPMSWALGAAGMGLGAAWGATQISNHDDLALWFSAPYGAGLGGLVSAGVLALAGWAGRWQDRTTMQAIGWTGFGWLTAGLGVAYAAPWIIPGPRASGAAAEMPLGPTVPLGVFEPLPGPRFGSFAGR